MDFIKNLILEKIKSEDWASDENTVWKQTVRARTTKDHSEQRHYEGHYAKDVVRGLAKNPNLHYDVADRLAAHRDPEVRVRVAMNTKHQRVLETLSKDEHEKVRGQAVKRAKSSEVHRNALTDESPEVHKQLLNNPKVKLKIKKQIKINES